MHIQIVLAKGFAVVGNIYHTAFSILYLLEFVYYTTQDMIGVEYGVVIGIQNLLTRHLGHLHAAAHRQERPVLRRISCVVVRPVTGACVKDNQDLAAVARLDVFLETVQKNLIVGRVYILLSGRFRKSCKGDVVLISPHSQGGLSPIA